MFKQQIIGVINLAIPVILFYQIYPAFLFAFWGKLLCAFVIGLYLYLVGRKSTLNMIKALQYAPTDEYKKRFEMMITACDMDPNAVSLLYAYTNEAIAITAYNTIIIDPVVWSTVALDPQAVCVNAIFEQFTNPTLSEMQRIRLAKVRDSFFPEVQEFIFKHELGHVYYVFSVKKLLITGLIGVVAAYSGIQAAMCALPMGGILAIVIGMLVGGVSDLVLSYLSNLFFKLQEEKRADSFAAHYSSRHAIEMAASFFEQHQSIMDEYGDKSFLSQLPFELVAGYQNGKARARRLRLIAQQ